MHQTTSILIIEDDPAVARGLEAGLLRDGYQVTWKDSGTAGVQFARHLDRVTVVWARLTNSMTKRVVADYQARLLRN